MSETSATTAALLRRIAQEVESAGVMPETLADIDQRLLHGCGHAPGWLPQRFTELVRSGGDRSLQGALRATLIVLGRIMRDRKAAPPEIRQLRACADAIDPPRGQVVPLPPPRMTVDLKCRTITLDQTPYDVRSENALRWVKVLSEHPNVWISGPELSRYDDLLVDVRTDRLRDRLPSEVSMLIDSETGRGSRIRLA